ncbi:MAG: virion core protein, T7 gp14 family [Methylocystis sp.]
MCGPSLLTAGASAGLGVLGAIGRHNAEQDAANRNNYQVLVNARDAGIIASQNYADQGRAFIYDARSAQQEAQRAVTQGRASVGSGLASAGTSGFTGSSLTVGNVLASAEQGIAQDEANYALKVDDLKDAYRTRTRDVQLKTQNQINSMAMQSGSSGSALGLNIANAVVGAGRSMLNTGY